MYRRDAQVSRELCGLKAKQTNGDDSRAKQSTAKHAQQNKAKQTQAEQGTAKQQIALLSSTRRLMCVTAKQGRAMQTPTQSKATQIQVEQSNKNRIWQRKRSEQTTRSYKNASLPKQQIQRHAVYTVYTHDVSTVLIQI